MCTVGNWQKNVLNSIGDLRFSPRQCWKTSVTQRLSGQDGMKRSAVGQDSLSSVTNIDGLFEYVCATSVG